MPLLTRIYFNALFGGLGGLLGWMLYGVFGDPRRADILQALLGGAIIGGSIGYFVVSVEAIRDRSLVRFSRLASYGLVLGAVGGAVGLWLGDEVNYLLMQQLGSGSRAAALLARGLGWMVLGLAVGFSEGIAARSLGKMSYGTIGGALGGFVGGVLFAFIYLWAIEKAAGPGVNPLLGTESWAALAGALGLVILGACIGALSALVQAVFQPASVRVLRGWQEGRDYALDKGTTSLGRDEAADIALFRDMNIEKRHAVIARNQDRYWLYNHAAPAQTQVNGAAVLDRCELSDGDRIQLGEVVLRFQRRLARARLKDQR
jgi:hypothetical protein